MKKIVSILSLFCICSIAFGQNINNHWILDNADMDLNTNPPTISTISNGQYGYVSVSDENGYLLFYLGKDYKFYNKLHQELPNSFAFKPYSNDGLRNPVVVVPKRIKNAKK